MLLGSSYTVANKTLLFNNKLNIRLK